VELKGLPGTQTVYAVVAPTATPGR